MDGREPEDVREQQRPDPRRTRSSPTLPAESSSWSAIWGLAMMTSGTHMTASTIELIRYGEYDRMSGAMATEYAAHVAAMPTATRMPAGLEKSPPEPSRHEANAQNETPAASENRRVICSTPASDPSPARPQHRAEHERHRRRRRRQARKRNTPGSEATRRRRSRSGRAALPPTRSDRSSTYVSTRKITVARP